MTESAEASGGPVMVSDWRTDLRSRLRDRLRPETLGPHLQDVAIYGAAKVASEFIEPLRAGLVAAEARIVELAGRLNEELNEMTRQAAVKGARILQLAGELDEATDVTTRQAAEIVRLKQHVDRLQTHLGDGWKGQDAQAAVTYRHVRLYGEAFQDAANRGASATNSCHAGLCAVVDSVRGADAKPEASAENASASETVDVYLGAGGPEMREVPFEEAREGDTVTVVGTIYRFGPPTGLGISVADRAFRSFTGMDPAVKAEIRITRPAVPLPTKVGSVGTATVQGRKGVRVMLADHPDLPWISATRAGTARFHAPEAITDYVPMPDGTVDETED